MVVRRGAVQAGEKVQLTDRKGKMLTVMLKTHGVTQTDRGFLVHDLLIGQSEGAVVQTISAEELKTIQFVEQKQKTNESSSEASTSDVKGKQHEFERKPWKSARSTGGWLYTMMRPRLTDFTLSMPRGAQIMYPKDVAQVLSMGDIRSGMRVLESGAGSGALSIALLDAVGSEGELTTVEIRTEFAKVARGNVAVFYGKVPDWWQLLVGDFDEIVPKCKKHYYDRIVLDQLDPWNRIDAAWNSLAPGGILTAYITTTSQVSRLAEALRSSRQWTEPQIVELIERNWKADGLAIRPQHQMIGHTGFLLMARSMASGYEALQKRTHATKNPYLDVDQVGINDSDGVAGDSDGLSTLELRDISDRKIRKVLRDLEEQEQLATADRVDTKIFSSKETDK